MSCIENHLILSHTVCEEILQDEDDGKALVVHGWNVVTANDFHVELAFKRPV